MRQEIKPFRYCARSLDTGKISIREAIRFEADPLLSMRYIIMIGKMWLLLSPSLRLLMIMSYMHYYQLYLNSITITQKDYLIL